MDRLNIERLDGAAVAKESAAGVDALSITGLHAWYGESHILHGVDLRAARGEVVTLLGRNGSGRSTTLQGDHGADRHARVARSASMAARPSACRRKASPGWASATARRSAASSRDCPARRTCCCRRSCGEHDHAHAAQRDLRDVSEPCRARAQARARVCPAASSRCWRSRGFSAPAPNLLLLDEISEGLAPVIVQDARARSSRKLKSRGYTILLVEQNFRFAAPLADRFYVMEHGAIVESFDAARLGEKMHTLQSLLNV